MVYQSFAKKQNMSSNWQIQLSTLRERSKYAFDKSLFCDVNFSVEDDNGIKVIIPSNKYMLAINSPVFAAMFYGNLAETRTTIDLPDCTMEGLQEIIRYAHCEEANLTRENVLEVLFLSKKYIMPFLEEKCKKYLEPEDVFHVLPQIQNMGDESLQEHLWGIADSETHRAISSESFLSVSKEVVCQLLERDNLRVSELHLFKAVDRWATKQIERRKYPVCDGITKRAVLGDEVIRLIRFSLMSEKEFVETVLPLYILSYDEVIESLQIFHGIIPSTHRRRRFLPDVMRFSAIRPTTPWLHSEPDAISLTVNKNVHLVGVRLFGKEGFKYDVQFKIYTNNRSDCLAMITRSSLMTGSAKVDGLYYGFTVMLDKPLQLFSGQLYTLEAAISGANSYSGHDGHRSVHVGDIVVTFANASLPNNGSNTDKGQFPSLILE